MKASNIFERFTGVLALDLATKTGYALLTPALSIGGTWVLESPHELRARGPLGARYHDPRPAALMDRIIRTVKNHVRPGPVLISWEDVEFVHSRDQITLWSGLRAAIWCAGWTLEKELGYFPKWHSVPVGTLKKFATGSGKAQKEDMERWAVRMGIVPADHGLDDNGIDAAWILHYAKQLE